MSQDQLQIFHAAFKPRVNSPKNQRERELDKLLYREGLNLELCHKRINRIQKDENIDDLSLNKGQTLLDKVRAEDKTLGTGALTEE